MKWPTMDEFAKSVAEKAVDEVEFNGKTIRQWIEIIAATEHGTNLAEVGTDCISREQAIDALRTCYDTETVTMDNGDEYINYGDAVGEIEKLPPAEPKRGKWTRDGHHIKCDQCGMYMCDTDREGDRIPTEFCPNCGAKMEVTE